MHVELISIVYIHIITGLLSLAIDFQDLEVCFPQQ